VARIAGYREVCFEYGAAVDRKLVARIEPGQEESQIGALMKDEKPEALVCANDRTAGTAMHALIALGYQIPRDVRVTGMDDVAYARLLPVPLTTVRQPVRQIGEVAMAAMLERMERPAMPVRDLLLGYDVVVRRSCGAASEPG
jgi:GntR family transcriptional regulator, arabinose operon transcriptional repressor